MVFSLFGKKPAPAPAKPAARPSPTPVAKTPAASGANSGSNPQPSPEQSQEPLEDLDFTSDKARSKEMADSHEGMLEGSIELKDAAPQLHPVIEEAAILYANGQDDAALATLEESVGGSDLGTSRDQVWAMLFDLYQLMEKREAFEQRAIDYSVNFEKSPPTWIMKNPEEIDPSLATGGQAYVAFVGALDEATYKQMAQLEKMISKNPMARVEFTKIASVDVLGAAMLLAAMKKARKAKCELLMSNAEQFAELIKRTIEVGRPDGEEIWLLLIELYQHMGEQDAFEEWALNYAITFELSPPSWEASTGTRKVVVVEEVNEPEESGEGMFELTGELHSASSDAIQRLDDYAATHDSVVIDCSDLKRMNFVSAGMFLNTLTNLRIDGKNVLIRRPNQLIWGLFSVLGIDQVAQVERRKF